MGFMSLILQMLRRVTNLFYDSIGTKIFKHITEKLIIVQHLPEVSQGASISLKMQDKEDL